MSNLQSSDGQKWRPSPRSPSPPSSRRCSSSSSRRSRPHRQQPRPPPSVPASLAALQQHPAASSSGRCTTAATAAVKPFTAHYYRQELDHFTFTPNSSRVFSQKYLLNDTFWRRKPTAGPLFVYTGNEGDIEWFAANTGFMFDIAPEFGALLVFIEHRFYGESKPFGNDSYRSADTLGYLTSMQALADFAVLITSLKHNLSAVDAPVVLFGGSYGGMLASWFRLKYQILQFDDITPWFAMGAVASSAPILQFDDITPWSSFYDTISQDFKSESMNYFSVIKAVWDVLDDRGSNDTGLLELSKTFRACKTVHSVYPLGFWLRAAFTTTAMADYPTPANFMMNLPAFPVKRCARSLILFPREQTSLTKLLLRRAYTTITQATRNASRWRVAMTLMASTAGAGRPAQRCSCR